MTDNAFYPIIEIIDNINAFLSAKTQLQTRTLEGSTLTTSFYKYRSLGALKKCENKYITPCVLTFLGQKFNSNQSFTSAERIITPFIMIDTVVSGYDVELVWQEAYKLTEDVIQTIEENKIQGNMRIRAITSMELGPFRESEYTELGFRTILETQYR